MGVGATGGGGPVAGAYTALAGLDVTERTTTSITAVDLVTISGLSILATTPIEIWIAARKSGGAAVSAGIGLTLNATNIWEATVGIAQLAGFSTTDRAEDSFIVFLFGPRRTNYQTLVTYKMHSTIDSSGAQINDLSAPVDPAARPPIATITSVIIRGISGSALVTLGAFGVYVFTKPVTVG